MNTYSILKLSTMWSTSALTRKVEQIIPVKEKEGWTLFSVAFGINLWAMPTAYITLKKSQ